MSRMWLFAPPLVFIVIFTVIILFAKILSFFAYKNPHPGKGRNECYACGEDVKNHRLQPNYSQFFPVAFFFTIIHVIALIISTVPKVTIDTFAIALIYIAGTLIGLSSLFRRSS